MFQGYVEDDAMPSPQTPPHSASFQQYPSTPTMSPNFPQMAAPTIDPPHQMAAPTIDDPHQMAAQCFDPQNSVNVTCDSFTASSSPFTMSANAVSLANPVNYTSSFADMPYQSPGMPSMSPALPSTSDTPPIHTERLGKVFRQFLLAWEMINDSR